MKSGHFLIDGYPGYNHGDDMRQTVYFTSSFPPSINVGGGRGIGIVVPNTS